MTTYTDATLAIKGIIEAKLTGYERVEVVFGLDYEEIIRRLATSDHAALISYVSGNVEEHYPDGSTGNFVDNMIVYIKSTDGIMAAVKAFINAFNANSDYTETTIGTRTISINNWYPVEDQNFDVMAIVMEVC